MLPVFDLIKSVRTNKIIPILKNLKIFKCKMLVFYKLRAYYVEIHLKNLKFKNIIVLTTLIAVHRSIIWPITLQRV